MQTFIMGFEDFFLKSVQCIIPSQKCLLFKSSYFNWIRTFLMAVNGEGEGVGYDEMRLKKVGIDVSNC